MPNHLVGETSPYLRQHMDNPVDWYPWNDEALKKAREEQKPIFLSIGYAACHWCHVMAHESFENVEIADFLNEHFVSIKVDREERPDLDDIYMQAVVMLTSRGGWPMSVFLTPGLKPFYGGSYFPPISAHGLPSFFQVLESVLNAWENKKTAVEKNASAITNAIESQFTPPQASITQIDLEAVVSRLTENYDWEYGGWGNAPKFPIPSVVEFLIQCAYHGDQRASTLVENLLYKMSQGGMYDLIGGGFHRYSTDDRWLVPHFEKMLYDNAQLASVYLHGYAVTNNPQFKQIAVETLEFLQRKLAHPKGGFYASLDADSPDGEGSYYTFTIQALRNALTPSQFDLLEQVTSISQEGNFSSQSNILQLKDDPVSLARSLDISSDDLQQNLNHIFSELFSIRSERIPPSCDEKIITAWNGLVIKAFAEAGLLLDRLDFLDTARKTTRFILNKLMDSPGNLKRSWNDDIANQPGTLVDYAAMILALGKMYEVDFDPSIFQMLRSLFQMMQKLFSGEGLFYYDSSFNTPHLITRPQHLQDNPIPSGNALAAHAHWLMGNYEYEPQQLDRAKQMAAQMNDLASNHPTSFGYWLSIAIRIEQTNQQIVLITANNLDSLNPFFRTYRSTYRPNTIIAAKSTRSRKFGYPNMLDNHQPVNVKNTAYICEAFTCKAPITDVETFNNKLFLNQ